MPTIIDLRPEVEKVSGRIAIVALLILCLCIKVYTTQFWHDMNVDHIVKCKVIDRIVDVCDYKFDYRFPTPFMKRHGTYGEYAKKVLRK